MCLLLKLFALLATVKGAISGAASMGHIRRLGEMTWWFGLKDLLAYADGWQWLSLNLFD